MIGYDIDGVITMGVIPEKDAVIITGRSIEEKERTLKMLEDKGIFNKVYFNNVKIIEKTHKVSGKWKAKMIKELKITEFYEDNETQAFEIIKATDCIVHIVAPVIKEWKIEISLKNNKLYEKNN